MVCDVQTTRVFPEKPSGRGVTRGVHGGRAAPVAALGGHQMGSNLCARTHTNKLKFALHARILTHSELTPEPDKFKQF